MSPGSVHQPGMAAGILAKKARLLVTNQLQYAPEATSIVYLEDGVVAASGTYDQISHNERFADLLHEYEVRTLPYPIGSTCARTKFRHILHGRWHGVSHGAESMSIGHLLACRDGHAICATLDTSAGARTCAILSPAVMACGVWALARHCVTTAVGCAGLPLLTWLLVAQGLG